ncbi:hypothetical protein A2U01_0019542, partial [Trifolium medium]|nr:hypothetical protein [Trifolium medium]
EQYDRFRELEKRKIWAEKKFDINEEGKYKSFVEAIKDRTRGKLINPVKTINYDVVREFYANVVPVGEEAFSYSTMPRSHTSDATINIMGLLYYTSEGEDVDVARIISNEMKSIAESGVRNFSRPKCPLAFPALIIGLVTEARVNIPQYVHDRIQGSIDDAYVVRYCTGKKKRGPAPQDPEEQQPQAPEHPAAPYAYPNVDPTLQNWFYHTWDQNAANYRAMTDMHESMYKMQLQEQMMTPPEFQTYANWPRDRPHFTEGVSTAAGADD